MITISEFVRDYISYLIESRRFFHQYPELGFEEIKTSSKISGLLKEWDYKVIDSIAKTGIIACINENGSGKPISIRIDMDGLPIEEKTNLDFESKIKGKMHACGHDMHIAIGLGLAKLFSDNLDFFNFPINFIFQPAEELLSGASKMIEENNFDLLKSKAIFGLHVWNQLEVGEIAINDGPIMASIDAFEVEVEGEGGHGSSPELAIDPIITLAEIVLASQTIISRNVSAKDEAVLSITSINAGDTVNVIPQKGKLLGSIRTYDANIRELIKNRFEEIVLNFSNGMNCKAKVKWLQNAPTLVNDKSLTEKIRSSINKLPYKNVENFKLMGSEDASYFWEKTPGLYMFIGAHIEGENLKYSHHHSKFMVDEKALEIGLITMLSSILTFEDMDWEY
jgi:amidohydrolase